MGSDRRSDAQRAGSQFKRQGRNKSLLGRKDERRAADDVVDVRVDVQRAQIGATSGGEPLRDCWEDRFAEAIRLPQNDLSGASASGEGAR